MTPDLSQDARPDIAIRNANSWWQLGLA
jgi:hypothetical protein